jgi:hypothetical protein
MSARVGVGSGGGDGSGGSAGSGGVRGRGEPAVADRAPRLRCGSEQAAGSDGTAVGAGHGRGRHAQESPLGAGDRRCRVLRVLPTAVLQSRMVRQPGSGNRPLVPVEQDLLELCGWVDAELTPRRPGVSLLHPPATQLRVDPGSRSERSDQFGTPRHARTPRRVFLGEAKRLWSAQRWPEPDSSGGTGRDEARTKHVVFPRGRERSVLENGEDTAWSQAMGGTLSGAGRTPPGNGPCARRSRVRWRHAASRGPRRGTCAGWRSCQRGRRHRASSRPGRA